ncbi:MFS general substrate transporter [Mrakia frigida]|uniref:MFS transporter n=1 Tax=Mrakia frigida TaxID=29902 RepID=UPI003FCC1A19
MEFGGAEERRALAAVFLSMALAGWNDSSIGPLLLAVGEHYKISYLALSSIFICRFVGFSLAGMTNVWLNDRLGFGRVIAFGACWPVVAYAIQSSAPPFPVLCLSYVISGVGLGFQDAQTQSFTARLPNMISKMSFLHAAFGFGALASPLVSTQFAQMPNFQYYFLISLGFSLINLCTLIYVFRFRTEESLLGPLPAVETVAEDNSTEPLLQLSSKQKMKQILSTRLVHIYAAFLFFYCGLEITVGSYIVTFFVKTRDGGAQSGLVSSGFFLGLTLGRLIFVPLNRRLGEKIVTLIYTMAALGLECVIWFVPSLIGNAIAVAFVGLVLGPMYPMVISALTKMLPRHLHSGAVGWVASVSQGGGALFPFLTGILASKRGIEVVPAVIVGILGAMLFFWVFTPKVPRRLD